MQRLVILLLLASAWALRLQCTHCVGRECHSGYYADGASRFGLDGAPILSNQTSPTLLQVHWQCDTPMCTLQVWPADRSGQQTGPAVVTTAANTCALDCHQQPLFDGQPMPADCTAQVPSTEASVLVQNHELFTVEQSGPERAWLCYQTQRLRAGQYRMMSFSEPDPCDRQWLMQTEGAFSCDIYSNVNVSSMCATRAVQTDGVNDMLCQQVSVDELVSQCRRRHDQQPAAYQLPSQSGTEASYAVSVYTSVVQPCNKQACDPSTVFQQSQHTVRVQVQLSGATSSIALSDPTDAQLRAELSNVWWRSDGELTMQVRTSVQHLFGTPNMPQTTAISGVLSQPYGSLMASVQSVSPCLQSEADRDVRCTQLVTLVTSGYGQQPSVNGERTFSLQLQVLGVDYAVLTLQLQVQVSREDRLATMQSQLRAALAVRQADQSRTQYFDKQQLYPLAEPRALMKAELQLAVSNEWAEHFDLRVDRVLVCRGAHPLYAQHAGTSGCNSAAAVSSRRVLWDGSKDGAYNMSMLSERSFQFLAPELEHKTKGLKGAVRSLRSVGKEAVRALRGKIRSGHQNYMLHVEWTAVNRLDRRRAETLGVQGSLMTVGCPPQFYYVDTLGCVPCEPGRCVQVRDEPPPPPNDDDDWDEWDEDDWWLVLVALLLLAGGVGLVFVFFAMFIDPPSPVISNVRLAPASRVVVSDGTLVHSERDTLVANDEHLLVL